MEWCDTVSVIRSNLYRVVRATTARVVTAPRYGMTASNARFPLFLTTTNCLDFLLLVAGWSVVRPCRIAPTYAVN